jgi:hypothetical protein
LLGVIADDAIANRLENRSVRKQELDRGGSALPILPISSATVKTGCEVPRGILAQGLDALAYDIRSKGSASAPVIASSHGERKGNLIDRHTAVRKDKCRHLRFSGTRERLACKGALKTAIHVTIHSGISSGYAGIGSASRATTTA